MRKKIISIILIFIVTFNLTYKIYDNYKISKEKTYAATIDPQVAEKVFEKIIVLLLMGGVAVQTAVSTYQDAPHRFNDLFLKDAMNYATSSSITYSGNGVFYLTDKLKELVKQFKASLVSQPMQTKIVTGAEFPADILQSYTTVMKTMCGRIPGMTYKFKVGDKYYLAYNSTDYNATVQYSNYRFLVTEQGIYLDYLGVKKEFTVMYKNQYGNTSYQTITAGNIFSATNLISCEDVLNQVDYGGAIDNTKSIDDYKTGLTVTLPNNFTYDDVKDKSIQDALAATAVNDDVIGSSDTTTDVGVLTNIWQRIIAIPDVINTGVQKVLDGIKTIPNIIGNVFDFLKDILQRILDAILSIPTLIQKIIDWLISMLGNLITALIDMIKTLVIPSDTTFTDIFTDIKAMVVAKFPYNLDILNSLKVDADVFSDINVTIMGCTAVIVSAYSVNRYIGWIRTATSCFWIFLIIMYLWRKFKEFITGNPEYASNVLLGSGQNLMINNTNSLPMLGDGKH